VFSFIPVGIKFCAGILEGNICIAVSEILWGQDLRKVQTNNVLTAIEARSYRNGIPVLADRNC